MEALAPELQLVYASQTKRFLNYIIDIIFFYALTFAIGIVIGIVAPGWLENEISDNNLGGNLIARIISLIIYALFMSIVEAISGGRSMGKIMTGTRAINVDGTKISFSTAFARGFSRAVPFDPFSALNGGHPWHDQWTKTIVIDEKLSDPLAFVVQGK